MDLIAEMEEHEIHRQVVGEQDISVSTYRLVVGEESVLMSKIQSASVYTHVEPDHDAEATLQRAKAKANMRFLGGVSVLALSLTAVLLISEMIQLLVLLLLGALPGLVLLISGLRRLRRLAQQNIRPLQSYYLRIETHAGPSDMLMSVDKKELDKIVQAISRVRRS